MQFDIIVIKRALSLIAECTLQYVPLFTKLDSFSGDGDMGVSLSKGFNAVKSEVDAYEGTDIGGLFLRSGLAFNRKAPSTLGTLLSSCLIALGKKFNGREILSDADVVDIPGLCSDTIMIRGNAQLGDKTILDALIPLSQSFSQTYAQTGKLDKAAQSAAQAARQGAKSTSGMLARIGRAKWIADRAKDYPDPGAVFCTIVMDTFAGRDRSGGYKLPDYQAMYGNRKFDKEAEE